MTEMLVINLCTLIACYKLLQYLSSNITTFLPLAEIRERVFFTKSWNISINRSRDASCRNNSALSRTRCIPFVIVVPRIPMAGYVRILIKSQPLVLFFCHCVSSTLGCDMARLSTVCIPRRLFPRCSFTASGRHLRASRFTTSRETFGALCPSGIKYSFRWLHFARG